MKKSDCKLKNEWQLDNSCCKYIYDKTCDGGSINLDKETQCIRFKIRSNFVGRCLPCINTAINLKRLKKIKNNN